MARRPYVPVSRVSIGRMSRSSGRTLCAEGKSEKTCYSYVLSVRLLREFLTERGHDLTVEISKDGIREFIALFRPIIGPLSQARLLAPRFRPRIVRSHPAGRGSG
jgi:hypothetical protein